MNKSEFTPWPSFTEEEAQAVSKILLSNKVNYWTGDSCRKFEQEFAQWCGCQYAVAIANGTLALEAALMAVGISYGDEVIVTARTFIASASAIVVRGGVPVFADVDSNSQTIDPEAVSKLITAKTKAIICVHLAGWPCDMDALRYIADKNSLYLIEDCAQAHGAMYKGRPVGSIGHIAAWSFCQDKIMTTGGEGGMVTTDDELLWSRVWSYKDHGKSYSQMSMSQPSSSFNWCHESIGSNYRMTEMQAEIGRLQLQRMNGWHEKRKQHAGAISHACEEYADVLRLPRPDKAVEHAWYKYYMFVNEDGLSSVWSRDRVVQEINSLGVPCYTGICPEVYREKAFAFLGLEGTYRLPVAHELGKSSLMLLVHPTLTPDEISMTCEVVTHVIEKARK